MAFTTACHVREMDGCASPITFNETLGSGVTITAPTTAAPGETITYRVQPNEMKANSGGHAAVESCIGPVSSTTSTIPSGVEFVSSQLVADSAYGLGSDSATPTVTRIDDGGNPSASGTHLRISGSNRTTGNGPSSAVRSSDGIIVGANTKFRLPAVDVTVKAGAAGTEIKPSLRVSDPGSATTTTTEMRSHSSSAKRMSSQSTTGSATTAPRGTTGTPASTPVGRP